MRRLYSPFNEMELINLRSILLGAEIPFFVHNDHYGSMKVGPRIELLNVKTIYVPEDHLEQARYLVDDYVATVTQKIENKPSFWHVTRMTLEALAFSWCMPYSHRARHDVETEHPRKPK